MDFLYKIDMGKLADVVQSEESTWDKVSDALVKMGFDFIIGDDIKTILDEDASTLDRVIAGLNFIPGGKVVYAGFKLAKVGNKIGLNLQFFGKITGDFVDIDINTVIITAIAPKKVERL
ncbi:hypothetical protein ACFSCX_16265 [Bacillus salitolerans]|uniref:Uncharacterized protein n=1 Tax=Bacillus salitolerans TaxID=1437434 RepID=A0ABW4LSH3_9BACI